MADQKVAHQGTVVETRGDNTVVQDGQGLVLKTEGNRFATLGADGFYHGYVPSTQVRDILMGAGEEVKEEDVSAMDLALQRAKDQDAPQVAGSEAPFPTGDVENITDPALEKAIDNRAAGETTDHDPRNAPATAAELEAKQPKAPKG